ncbi:hypothetical protein [Cellulomonas sp. P24]|uniref:hypothetical protein n=1 Tax=Cellulomonas sp. P24 TaxID=2885206 RepID=UPI00216B61FF|nr:hypothetical protein [Cellulomonas sp. P24]MCR6492646.1 hypothetical protein [Cellulomonas sp. P24]
MTSPTDGDPRFPRGLRDPAALLTAWELAGQAPPSARAAVLVHRAGLTGSLDEALDLDVGTCAGLALQVYRDTFGEVVDAVVECPGCGERMEAGLPTDGGSGGPGSPGGPGQLGRERTVGAWVVRAPTARDLVLIAERAERDGLAAARDELLRRCVRPAAVRGGEVRGGGVSGGDGAGAVGRRVAGPEASELAVIEAAAEELAGAAVLVSVVTCPECGTAVDVSFDAGAMLWDRVAAAAPELLADVASLARAYGWNETEVLALPPVRRRAYLALADR